MAPSGYSTLLEGYDVTDTCPNGDLDRIKTSGTISSTSRGYDFDVAPGSKLYGEPVAWIMEQLQIAKPGRNSYVNCVEYSIRALADDTSDRRDYSPVKGTFRRNPFAYDFGSMRDRLVTFIESCMRYDVSFAPRTIVKNGSIFESFPDFKYDIDDFDTPKMDPVKRLSPVNANIVSKMIGDILKTRGPSFPTQYFVNNASSGNEYKAAYAHTEFAPWPGRYPVLSYSGDISADILPDLATFSVGYHAINRIVKHDDGEDKEVEGAVLATLPNDVQYFKIRQPNADVIPVFEISVVGPYESATVFRRAGQGDYVFSSRTLLLSISKILPTSESEMRELAGAAGVRFPEIREKGHDYEEHISFIHNGTHLVLLLD